MASASLGTAPAPRPGSLLLACVAGQGSAAHAWPRSPLLLRGTDARALADLIHFVCLLHGRYPGVVDHAAAHTLDPAARAWLTAASYAFAGERAFLARLAVAAGPLPSTPGAADSDGTVQAQRHAIETLACSERNGCALGAAMALVLDWASIRIALDAAAVRFGIDVPPCEIVDAAAIEALAASFAVEPATRRALLFGAEQILVQHYGLWDLLETRHQARAAA
ncbi:MAG: hypothetical protein QOH04_169 [Sphingomonadales bacterium]|jgi:hypothetical protein|nr:hypothetical protein [Sphingomonadales bacterium]MEA3034418.1 hypothetical protein [Sphingomonadales bacterium]